jgi:glycosyltransferase involved in cell wall biosynthesis
LIGATMRLNWLAYNYREYNGYGKYSNRLIAALRKQGVSVRPELAEACQYPDWLQAEKGLSWDGLTISCLPPYYLRPLRENATGQHWLLTMTEGGKLPAGWADMINRCKVDRVIVPCEHNAQVFREGGVHAPISVIAGGTDPDEFPLITGGRPERPYTFLTLADRGYRKGWLEVYQAFYTAFGGKTTGMQDVRLIIKCRPDGNELIETILALATDLDPRVTFRVDDVTSLGDLYKEVDCLALPSRTEGWGMPHREAAMMGLPVITQAHSGLDDGHTREWALVVSGGQMRQIDDEGNIAGEWMVADVGEVAHMMRAVYDEPWAYRKRAKFAREWLKTNQTWDHAASALIRLLVDEGALPDDAAAGELKAIRTANRWYFDQHEMSYEWQH